MGPDPEPDEPRAKKNHPGDPSKVNQEAVSEAILNQRSFVQRLSDQVHSKMEALDPVEALRCIRDVISEASRSLPLKLEDSWEFCMLTTTTR